MSWEGGAPHEAGHAPRFAPAVSELEGTRIVGLVGAWCLLGGAAAGVLGFVMPPAVVFFPMALVGAWVFGLVALAQTRSSVRRMAASVPGYMTPPSTSRLAGDLVMTLFSATALAPLATMADVTAGHPGMTPAEHRSSATGARARRVGAWLTFVVGVLWVGALIASAVWVYQQWQRDVQGPDAWYVLAPIVVGLLGGWLLMVVNGVTTLICLSIGRTPSVDQVRNE